MLLEFPSKRWFNYFDNHWLSFKRFPKVFCSKNNSCACYIVCLWLAKHWTRPGRSVPPQISVNGSELFSDWSHCGSGQQQKKRCKQLRFACLWGRGQITLAFRSLRTHRHSAENNAISASMFRLRIKQEKNPERLFWHSFDKLHECTGPQNRFKENNPSFASGYSLLARKFSHRATLLTMNCGIEAAAEQRLTPNHITWIGFCYAHCSATAGVIV